MELTCAFVSLETIKQNFRAIQSSTDSIVMPSVKANGYGHGAIPVTKACIEAGAQGVCVATISEGIQLRNAGIDAKILVLCTMLHGDLHSSVEHDLVQTVTTPEMVFALEKAAKALGKTAQAHLNVETGINRAGVSPRELEDMLKALQASPHVNLEGVYTHFASSDSADKTFANEQISRFEKIIKNIRAQGFEFLAHASNSGAVHELRHADYDIVRPGISIYGLYPSLHIRRDIPLRPALEWKTKIVRIKNIEPKEPVSYNSTWVAWRKTKIAVIAVGYGDGFKRSMSGKASVLINGKRAEIIGTICMDQCMVDITDIDASVGDEVVLIGKQGDERIMAEEMARWADTINYEILLSIGNRVQRIYE